MIFILDLGLIISTFFYQYKNKKKYSIPFYLVVVLMLTAGLRYNYNLDYDNYRIIFNEINTFSQILKTVFEKGFAILIVLFKKLGLGFYTFMLTIAAASVALKCKFFNTFSSIPMLSVLIYFLAFFIFNDMEQIRHGLSIAIALSSVIFVLENKFWKFTGVVLIASLIHYSAVLFLFLYFVRNIRFNSKKIYFLFLAVVALSFVDFMNILKFLNNNFINNSYLTNKLSLYDGQSIGVISFTLILRIAIALIYYKFIYNSENKKDRVFFNAYILGICIFCLFRSVSILGVRSSVYFRYFELLLIPEYIVTIKKIMPKQIKCLSSINNAIKKILSKSIIPLKKLDNLQITTITFHYMFIILLLGYYIIKFIETLSVSNYFIYNTI